MMSAIAGLRPDVDVFFDSVTVNTDNPAVRVNRLQLLAEIRAALSMLADFSLIEDAA